MYYQQVVEIEKKFKSMEGNDELVQLSVWGKEFWEGAAEDITTKEVERLIVERDYWKLRAQASENAIHATIDAITLIRGKDFSRKLRCNLCKADNMTAVEKALKYPDIENWPCFECCKTSNSVDNWEFCIVSFTKLNWNYEEAQNV